MLRTSLSTWTTRSSHVMVIQRPNKAIQGSFASACRTCTTNNTSATGTDTGTVASVVQVRRRGVIAISNLNATSLMNLNFVSQVSTSTVMSPSGVLRFNSSGTTTAAPKPAPSTTAAPTKSSPWRHLNMDKSKSKTSNINNDKKKGESSSSPRPTPTPPFKRTNNKSGNTKNGNIRNDNIRNGNTKNGNIRNGNNRNENHKKGNNSNISEKPNEEKGKPHPIDKLRDSFLKSLQSDRERRQQQQQESKKNNNNSNNNNNNNNNRRNINDSSSSNSSTSSSSSSSKQNNISTESKLDQLLRMSRQRPIMNSNFNDTNANKSGAKAFRERRKLEQQERQQTHKQSHQRQRQNQHSPRHHQQQQQNNNNNYYNQNNFTQQTKQERQQIQATHRLRNELKKENPNYIDPKNRRRHKLRNDDDKAVILPNKDLSLIELSTLLRVNKEKIIKTLRSLGEFVNKKQLITASSASDDNNDAFTIDADMAELIALDLELDPQRAKRSSCQLGDAERRILRMEDDEDDDANSEDISMVKFPSRPPVVCIMGHVDHGKTTLMDCLRNRSIAAFGGGTTKKSKKSKKAKKKGKSGQSDDGLVKVAGTEAGGITQTVSAFQVALPTFDDDKGDTSKAVDKVTFLDTPGHAAFKAMRQSGSNGADVIVLVIAADDGVSPQTIEIIDMYKSIARSQPDSISMVVAMTKVDKPGIDVDESIMRIENQLMEHEIFSEHFKDGRDNGFGGIEFFPVSGLTGEGLDDLIEGLVLQSDIMDLRADDNARAEGIVIDAKMEKGLGVVADCIVRWGKLEVGDYVVSGVHGGRVRILNDVNNKSIKNASPSQPVRIVGLKSLPKAGDPIVCVQSEEMANEIISRREVLAAKESHRAETSGAPLDLQISGTAAKKGFMTQNVLKRYGLGDNIESEEEGKSKDEEKNEDEIRIPVILKADADGTLAALRDTLLAIQDESKLNLCIDPIALSIGHITPSDVNMAAESGAGIFCFNLKGAKDKTAMSLAATEGVDIRSNDVIYHLLNEAKELFSTYCPPTSVEKIHGKATIKAVFDINNNRNSEKVAGLMVENGTFYLDKSSKDSGSLDCHYRVIRGNEVISPETLSARSLRREKEEVKSVRFGEECGLNLLDFVDIQEGDKIECFSTVSKRIFV